MVEINSVKIEVMLAVMDQAMREYSAHDLSTSEGRDLPSMDTFDFLPACMAVATTVSKRPNVVEDVVHNQDVVHN